MGMKKQAQEKQQDISFTTNTIIATNNAYDSAAAKQHPGRKAVYTSLYTRPYTSIKNYDL